MSRFPHVAYASFTDKGLVRGNNEDVVFALPHAGVFGVSDVDTLQTLCGGKSILLTPTDILLEQAYASGARNLVDRENVNALSHPVAHTDLEDVILEYLMENQLHPQELQGLQQYLRV